MPHLPRLFRALRAIALLGLSALVLASVGPANAADARRKIIIDQDTFGPGGSNMQSVLMLLQAPDVEVIGITVTSGDGWRDEEVAAVLRLLEIAQRPEVPVYAGAVYPLVNSQARTKAWEQRHGALVYKGAWMERTFDGGATERAAYHADPYLVPPSPAGSPTLRARAESAAAFMARTVAEFPGQVTIWCGGPMTNVALAARLNPQFASLAKELVFMGGSFNPVAVNSDTFASEYAHSPRREFNMRWDPEAASLVLHEPWRKITQVPIDPTTKTMFSKALYTEIARGTAPFVSYVVAYGQGFPMWDELAAAVWLDPTLVTRKQTLLVDIETGDGAAYGDTLSWPLAGGPALGERPVEVVQDIDLARFERLTVRLLSQRR